MSETVRFASIAAVLAIATLLAARPSAAASASGAAPMSDATPASGVSAVGGRRIAQRLRTGGCVLVMRHAQAPAAVPDARTAESDNPRHERQLDETGKRDARELGAALRALHIPIGPVYSSPTYRALETARLAEVGSPEIVAELAESARGMSGDAEGSRIEWLRRAVNRAPPPRTNALIVTHAPNILGAFGREAEGIRAGEMLVFEVQRRGGARLLGRVTIEAWRELARER